MGKMPARWIGLILLSLSAFRLSHAAPPEKRGVLVMAHGGGPVWNETVRRMVDAAGISQPVEIFYGMATSPGERESMAKAIAELRRRGAARVVAVPLLVSSHSEVYRQYQYMLGLRDKPGFSDEQMRAMGGMHHGTGAPMHHASMGGPLTPAVEGSSPPITLTGALDGEPEVLAALKDRALAVSSAPAAEAVILVAHGPNEEEDNRLWLSALEGLARALKTAAGFADVRTATLRDDAPPAVRDGATRRLRGQVESLSHSGKTVLVVPVLISAGGIEEGLLKRLEGLPCRIGQPMGGHPALSAWIGRKAAETSAR